MPSRHYAKKVTNPSKTVKARGSDLRVHFKTAMAIRGMSLKRAQKYMSDVLVHKDAIPFRRFTGKIGRHAQGKLHKAVQSGWPKKSAEYVLSLLQNAQANADAKGLDASALHVSHVQVNQAQKQRRRTYRAHGRINPYMSSPCHIEVIFEEKDVPVPKAKDASAPSKKKVSKKKEAREKAVQRTQE